MDNVIDKSFEGRLRAFQRELTQLDRRLGKLPDRIAGDATDLGTENLNDITTSGWRVQVANANATLARNYPATRAGYLEVIGSTAGSDFVLQRYTDYQFGNNIAGRGITWVRTYYSGSWSAWRIATPQTSLPLPYSGTGSSPITVGSTTWAAIPGAGLRLELPPYPQDMLMELTFGAEGAASTGYWMIGISAFQSSGPTWAVQPEDSDPRIGTATALYGLYAPFASTSTQTHSTGSKSFVIPAGVAATFQMAMRKSVSTATSTLNYASMEARPQRWV